MSVIQRNCGAIFATLIATGIVLAQEETKPESAQSTKPSRAEVREKQLDVSLEARDIERVLTKLKRASELSKTRISEAAKTAESASTALDKGDSKGARSDAEKTTEMFREIVKLLEALLAEETPQRVAAARNLADRLAKMERQFAQQFPGATNSTGGGKGKVDPKSQVKPKPGQGSGAGAPKKKMDPQDGIGAGEKKKNEDGDNTDDPMKDSDGNPKGKTEKKNGADGKGTPDKAEDKDGDGIPDSKQEPREGEGGTGKTKVKDEGNSDDPMKGGGDNAKDNTEKKTGGDGKGTSSKHDENDNHGTGAGGSQKDQPMTEEERREALARRAEQLEKMGETLKDVLQAISQSNEPGDKEAVAKLEAILKETDLLKAIESMKDSAEMIRSDKYDDARLASLDLADRLEIVASRLDAAYRAIVAPQAEELRKLEQALADLREKLDELETQGQIAAWHRDTQDLLDQAEKLGISDKVREDLLEQMKKAGFGVGDVRNRFNWGFVNNYYVPPDGYSMYLVRMQEEVQARIQSLVLGDFASEMDENTPPKYRELVDRYYEVLSRENGAKKADARNTKPEAKAKMK